MNISPDGIRFTKNFEGCILHAYKDIAGVWTIGWGNTSIHGRPVREGDTISQADADNLIALTLASVALVVTGYTASVVLNQNQFDALCDFAYNAGDGALKTSSLLKKILINPHDPSITSCFMMWDKAHVDGQLVEVNDLKKRRQAEANLYFS